MSYSVLQCSRCYCFGARNIVSAVSGVSSYLCKTLLKCYQLSGVKDIFIAEKLTEFNFYSWNKSFRTANFGKPVTFFTPVSDILKNKFLIYI